MASEKYGVISVCCGGIKNYTRERGLLENRSRLHFFAMFDFIHTCIGTV